MILHHRIENSSIIVEHSQVTVMIHIREWRNDQQIKDARIELSKEQIKEFIKMLERE